MPDYVPPPSNLPPGSIVWAYLRDSGGESQERSVSEQRAEIEAYCLRHGLVLGHIFQDIAKSGGSVTGRGAFQDMIDLSTNEDLRPAGVLLWNFARFSRDLDESTYYKASLRRRGIIVHSLTDPIPEGPFSRVIETLIDFSNDDFKRQNRLNVKRSLQTRFQDGFSFGIPPKGYQAMQVEIGIKRNGKPRLASRWMPDPDLADLVRLAWTMRAEGKTYDEIRRATHGRIYTAKNSWHCFFSNLAYLGIGKWGELEIPNHHPALIDQATWDAVKLIQAQSQKPYSGQRHPRRLGSDKRTGGLALLSGLAYCPECGAAMVKDRAGNHWDCYICGRKRRHGWTTCKSRYVNARAAEAAIIDAVLNQILTPGFVTDLLNEENTLLNNTADLAREKARIERDIKGIKRAIANLLDLAESDGAQDVLDRLRERRTQQGQLAFELRRIEAALETSRVELTPEALALTLASWRNRITETQKAGDLQGIKSLLARFVTRVDLGYNTARIMYSFPLQVSALNVDTDLIYSPVGAQA